MDEAQKQAILGAVRTALVALGGIVARAGWVDDNNIDLYAGALVIILGAIWSIWDKYHTEVKTQAREATALNAGITYSNSDPNQTPPVPTVEAQAVIKAVTAQAPPITGSVS